MRRRWGFVVVGAVLHVTPARAGGPVPLEIEYEAPTGCPDAATFAGRVRARVHGVRSALPGEAQHLVRVVIERENGGQIVAQITSVDPDAETGRRQVAGRSCQEVTDAAALMIALDVERPSAPRRKPPRRLEALRPLPPILSQGTAEDVTAAETPEAIHRPTWAGAVWANLGMQPLGGVPASILEAGIEARRERLGAYAPAHRLSLLYVASRGRESVTAGTFATCPIRAETHFGLVEPCLRVELGSHMVKSIPTESEVRERHSVWLSPGLAVRTEVRFYGTFLHATAGGGMPILRQGREREEPLTVLMFANAGLGFRFL